MDRGIVVRKRNFVEKHMSCDTGRMSALHMPYFAGQYTPEKAEEFIEVSWALSTRYPCSGERRICLTPFPVI